MAMQKINIKRKINLDFLGEEYKGSFIIANEPSIEDVINIKDKPEAVFKYLKESFVEGEIHNNAEIIKMTADDLVMLPGSSIIEIFQLFLVSRVFQRVN